MGFAPIFSLILRDRANPQVSKAPIVDLKLKGTQPPFQETETYLGFIDTGSDITLVPMTIISKLQVVPIRRRRLNDFEYPTGLGGVIIAYTAYWLKISFNDNNFYGVRVWGAVGDTQELIIIGRNFLNNRFNVFLDGENLITTIQPLKKS